MWYITETIDVDQCEIYFHRRKLTLGITLSNCYGRRQTPYRDILSTLPFCFVFLWNELHLERKWILWGVWRVMAYEYLFFVSLFIFVSKQSMKMLQWLSCFSWPKHWPTWKHFNCFQQNIDIILRRKKVQSPAKQFKELFSLCPNHFRGLTMFVFNFGVESFEQSVKLGRLLTFDFLGNSLL